MTLHRPNLPRDDIVTGRGFAVTIPLHSIIDVAATHPDHQLSRLIPEELGRGRRTVRMLRSRAEEVDAHAPSTSNWRLPAATAR